MSKKAKKAAVTAAVWKAGFEDDALLATVDRYLTATEETAGAAIAYLIQEDAEEKLERDIVYEAFGLATDGYEVSKTAGQVLTSVHRQIGLIFEDAWRGLIALKAGVADPADLKVEKTFSALGVTLTRKYDCVLDENTLPEKPPSDFAKALAEVTHEVMEKAREQLAGRNSVASVGGGGKRARKALKNEEALAVAEARLKDAANFHGLAFEIRHCYKSADSKRKQGDVQAAATFIASGWLPVMIVFCKTATGMEDYRRNGWVVYEGEESFALLERLSGYDLEEFMEEHVDDIAARAENLGRFFENVLFDRERAKKGAPRISEEEARAVLDDSE